MRISDYKEFIQRFPYLNQSFNIESKNWEFPTQQDKINRIFNSQDSITLNRNDLYNSRFNISEFIIRTLMWGYPTKGRGNNIKRILEKDNFEYLKKILDKYRDSEVFIEQIVADTKVIKGLGMSTMTKFTTFLNTTIHGNKSVILDNQIMKVIDNMRFDELRALKGIGDKTKTFLPYVKTLNVLSKELKVDPSQIELFLFMFGNNLSELQGENCYDYD